MEAPLTPKPDRLHPSPELSLPTANQYAGIAYITLAGLVDTMVPAAGPWALVGQSASYLIKLAPFLWWALPSSQLSKLAAEANSHSPGMQYPDRLSVNGFEHNTFPRCSMPLFCGHPSKQPYQ
ncbi:hypothetical protein DSO57_1000496 [Entomophthora muscae]|uniref:Uncharacterized protein n=1 Tax=Entomophthora muscae TaxID=34485 RepID=A0ACC2RP35_9FUNG|nr:hypothetical protein DSO57_1000496 [Entomophthora muscae]